MRDFRHFRDAWLQVCGLLPASSVACPPAAEVALNGAVDIRRKHLNFDGCVNPLLDSAYATCPTAEYIFPRLTSTATVSSRSIIERTYRRDHAPSSDVLQYATSRRPEDSTPTTSSGRARQPRSDEVTVSWPDPAPSETFNKRTLKQADGFIVVTVPLDAAPTDFEGSRLRPGRRCPTQRRAEADQPALGRGQAGGPLYHAPHHPVAPPLPADGATIATLTATLSSCGGGNPVRRPPGDLLGRPGTGTATLSPLLRYRPPMAGW